MRWAARPPRPTKAHAASWRASSTCAPTNWCSAAAPPSPSTWWRIRGRCRGSRPGDAILRHPHGAPRQHRALAAGRPAHRRDHQGGGAAARRQPRPRRAACGDDARREAAGADPRLQRARHRQPGGARSAAKRASAGSRRWSTARRPRRTCRSTSRRSAATSTRSPATRCAGPPAPARCGRGASTCDAMPPFLGGGEMIREVRFEGTVFNEGPHKFEAGTPNIAGFVGLGAAVDYLSAIGMANIAAREQALLAHATEELRKIDGLRISRHRAAQGRGGQLRDRGHAFARPRHPARPRRRRRTLRPALRAPAAAMAAAWAPPAAPRWRSTTRTRKSMRSSPRCAR